MSARCCLRPYLLLLLVSAAACARAQDSFPTPGEWPCERRTASLQARSPLKGSISTPRILWRQYTGALRTYLTVEPGVQSAKLLLPASNTPQAALDCSDPRWGLSLPEGEIGGRPQPLSASAGTVYAEVRPDLPGLEKIVFESGFDLPTVNGQWQPCVGRCFGWQNGGWQQLWQTPPIDMLFSALPLTGDFDRDGALEIAFLPWYELIILDARTGAIKYRCRFTSQRSYGFFGAHDLDNSGTAEFLVQADFCKHVDVLGFREGRLQLLWQREIETNISSPQKVFRAYPRPVAEVDGDGRVELMLSIYNETGDRRWHLTVCDPLTGRVKADLAGEYLQGIFDLDGDGISELLTTVTAGAGPPPYGTIRVHSLRGGQFVTQWEGRESAWATYEPPAPPNVNTAATDGRRDVLCRESPEGAHVALRRRDAEASAAPELLIGQWRGGSFVIRTRLSGAPLEPLALSPQGALLAAAGTAPGQTATLEVHGGQARALSAELQRDGALTMPSVVRAAGEQRPTVIVQGPGEQLVAFHPPQGELPARERWRLEGRPPGEGWPDQVRAPVVADLWGDGRRQVLYATGSPAGGGRLVAVDLDGRELWHHDFPAIPGTPPMWNTGGLILWQTGHLTDPTALDVVVTVRRSMMHSEETYGLSGRDGHELWHRDRQTSDRGVGGTPFALADFDGDGLDDLASFHPSLVYLLKGSTGRDLIARDAVWQEVPAKPVYWGLPIAGDFLGTGKPALLFASTRRSFTGVVRADGGLAWGDALDLSPQCLPAVGDLDGDGVPEILGIGYEDGVRCYEAATGRIEWRLPAPAPGRPRGSAAGDLDSDGRDEALFTIGSTLYCLGADPAGQAGRLLWQVDLPAAAGAPVIADVDGSGRAAVLVMCSNREVCCVR